MENDAITEPTAEPVAPISSSDAEATALALFLRAEAALQGIFDEADALGAHGEFSSLRGLLKETMKVLSSGRPGGVK